MGRGQLGAEVRGQEELLKPQSGPRPHGQGERLGPACLEDTQPPGRVEPWQERPPRRPGTPTWALAPPRALPSGAQPRIHQKPCAPAASLRGRRPAPRLPLLAPAGAAPRAHTARPPPGFIHKDLLEASRRAQEAQPPAPQRAGGQASESHTPGSGTVPISNPASLLSGPRKGRLSREASASSPQHSRIAVLPGAAPRFFFSLLASVPLLQVLPLLPDGLF